MQEYELQLLQPAWRELDAIAEMHLALVGAVSAQKKTDAILSALELLERNPFLGIACEDPLLAKEHYRKLIVGNYICFYRILSNQVLVYHIVDGRKDYPKLLVD